MLVFLSITLMKSLEEKSSQSVGAIRSALYVKVSQVPRKDHIIDGELSKPPINYRK